MAKGIGYLKDAVLGKDGFMHPEATLTPETGRLSYRRPNFQNQPKGRLGDHPEEWDLVEAEVAKAIRSTVIARPGYKLMELDWVSMEALLLSYFANDPDYARISRLGAHAYLMSHIIGKPASLEWDDKKLKAYLKEVKESDPDLYHISKIFNLGDTYDIGVQKAAKVLRCSRTRAQELKDIRKRAFPKIAEWQLRIRLQAHSDGKLTNPFGFTFYFWNVFARGKDGKWRPQRGGSGQANECLAFLPQSTNAMMMRDVIVDLSRLPGYEEDFHLLVPIHDALLLEVREAMVPTVRKNVSKLMTRKWAELDGLSVGVDTVVGDNWGKMEASKDEEG